MNKIETRLVELRISDEEDRIINGSAIVFNSISEPLAGGRFNEIIKPESVDDELINSSDIVMLYNHNNNIVPLARRKKGKGTLNVELNDKSVNFSFKAKNTNMGNEILEAVRNGDLDSCSFAFKVAEGGDDWEKRDDGSYLRTIKKIGSLHDFSIVLNPAYVETEVNLRGLYDLKEQEELLKKQEEELKQKELELKQKEEDIKKEQELTEYYKVYDDLTKTYNQ